SAVALYLVAYTITTLIAFGVITVLSGTEREAETMDDIRGLFWRRPWLAAVMTAAMLSLAGIPLTAGFVGKFVGVAAGVSAALWLLVGGPVLAAGLGLCYDFRVVVAMYWGRPAGEPLLGSALSLGGGIALTVLGLLLV